MSNFEFNMRYESYMNMLNDMETLAHEVDECAVYDDTTIGAKETWSSCGSCAHHKDLRNRRKFTKQFPCPFDKRIEEELESATKISEYTWWGCYHECHLYRRPTATVAAERVAYVKRLIGNNKTRFKG